jgi:hypothetical protein
VSRITSASAHVLLVLDFDAADGDHVAGAPGHERHDDGLLPVRADGVQQVRDAEPGRRLDNRSLPPRVGPRAA